MNNRKLKSNVVFAEEKKDQDLFTTAFRQKHIRPNHIVDNVDLRQKFSKNFKKELVGREDTPKNTFFAERDESKFKDLVKIGPNTYKTKEPVTYVNVKHNRIQGNKVKVVFFI